MNKRLLAGSLVLLISLAVPPPSGATTWAPKEVVCPNCKTTNTFQAIMSYGSYIYSWPSKFQYIFWPLIDSPVLYCCKKCRLTAFMWDFEQLPKDKFPAIQKQLNTAKLDGSFDVYTKIPMSARLLIAEKVYSELSKDDDFWCRFYRVLGYHLETEKKEAEAAEARKKALRLAEKMAGLQENAGSLKELLLISGAMRHFLNDDAGALRDFKQAQGLKFQDPSDAKRSENVDAYLAQLLAEYIQTIQTTQKTKTL
ncbi:MAG TPA: hypothetical protein VFV34_03820 [Blastocatellia bacterium]|nr:hypothetical protein [Blastocatellia bacterium]